VRTRRSQTEIQCTRLSIPKFRSMQVYIVNAFTSEKFGGNPAAVVPLQDWLPDEILQHIAEQHNLSETAYVVPDGENYSIRWFTPTVEVDLCGHATLAAAHVLFSGEGSGKKTISFQSRSGSLVVHQNGGGKITLDFPAYEPEEIPLMEEVERGLSRKPLALYKSPFDYMAVFENQGIIENLSPHFQILAAIPGRGLITTAPGDRVDFVSRCFYPQSGINEDPVTGSAHTIMTPYWAKKLGKNRLSAIQISTRRGYLDCQWAGERVLITGHAVTYLEGKIEL
jgi:PhzF family phenazine biosynthesis protein